MKRTSTWFLGMTLLLGGLSVGRSSMPAWGANSVVVESKTVQGGTHDVQIGIYLTNDVSVRNIVLPITLRSVSGGAFITKMAVKRTAGTRLSGLLTAINEINGFYSDPDSLHGCRWQDVVHPPFPWIDYKGFYHIRWTDTLSHVDTVIISGADTTVYSVAQPPVAALFACGKIFGAEPSLPAGSDSDTLPSFRLLVDIGNSVGQFEIDTVCTGPNNHLIFLQDKTNAGIVPQFTKGTITVICTKTLPVPSVPIPADTAKDQPMSVMLKWDSVIDSCGNPVTYDVFFGSGCDSLALKCGDISVDTCLATGLSPNTSYYWKVMAQGTGDRQTSGPCWSFKVGTGSAVQYLGGDGLPRDYALDQNYPNPFNASTVIKFNTKHDGHVRIDVYNIIGQKVRTLVDEFRQYGPQAADWDGTDAVGKAVPTGLYFYRLVTSDFTDVKKMVLLK